MRNWAKDAILAGVMGAALCVGARGQNRTQNPGSVSQPPNSSHDPMSDPRVPAINPAAAEKMAISRNEERQRKLVADTNQLLDLATKLKEEVDKTDKYTLSIDVVKRTAEIEKLAKSIRERMKD